MYQKMWWRVSLEQGSHPYTDDPPFWSGVSESVGGISRWQLTRLALL